MMHCMLDVETLGTGPGAPVVSLGAVAFDRHGVHRDSALYVVLELNGPLVVDAGTLSWWMQQSDGARAVFYASGRTSLDHARALFSEWYAARGCERVWCHGAGFDAPILTHAFGGRVPWGFRDVRDTRTLYELADVKLEKSEGAHNALHDAVTQAEVAQRAIATLGAWDRL